MHRFLRVAFLALVALSAVQGAAYAQASIGGAVKDTSGAVLPGVTVEASSPALIEKTRSVVTDGSGQYKIEQLRPGPYTVTFTLTGFNTIKRDGIELTGSFAATVSVEMRVGAVAETITVTGEAPLVDVQSGTRQRVLGQEVLTELPTGRTQFTAATLIPGMNLSNQDVGGTNIINTTGGSMTIHGSNGNDQRVMIDGVSTANAEGAGQASNFLPNFGSVQEIAVDYSSGTADQMTGGVRINMIPREGGNAFKGSFFATGVNDRFQGSNYTQDLIDRGLRTPNSIKTEYDVNPGFGGPLRRDQLWFYATARLTKTANYVGGMFYNKNAGIENVWSYDPDLTRPAFVNASQSSLNLRLTWQASLKNKFGFFFDDQDRCQCANVTATTSPEAAIEIKYPIQRLATMVWTSPVSNRLLLEARGGFRGERYKYNATPVGDPSLRLITVTEQLAVNGAPAGLQYHGGGIGGVTATQPFQNTYGRNFDLSAAASYVTGTHAFKAGISDTIIIRDEQLGDNDFHVSYRFNNGVPNQITERTTPYEKAQRQPAGIGLYAQDKWTLGQLTLNLGARFDYLHMKVPAQHLSPAPLVPNRNLDLPETDLVRWKDVTPRLAAVYDLFGNGKTAVKASISRYVIAQGLQGAYGDSLAPVNRLANFVARTWTDNNQNFTPDCDLTNVLAQGPALAGALRTVDNCGLMQNQNFGLPTPSTTVDPAVLNGFGVRPDNWEFSTGIQHQVLPRVSADFGYFRRWFGNFAITDNRAIKPSNYSPYSITAPVDARLPGGGGYVVSGLFDQDFTGAVDNYFTAAANYGEQLQHWNGVDMTVNARLGRALLQGGVSTGRTLTDNCDLATKSGNPSQRFCRVETALLTQVKFLGVYAVPKVDVQVSGAFQSIPGPQIAANLVVGNAQAAPSLGRNLTNGTATVNLIEPGTQYGERLNQLDLRFSKIFRINKARLSANLDLYNAFNVDTVLSENATFTTTTTPATWRVPTAVVTARFFKFSAQFDF